MISLFTFICTVAFILVILDGILSNIFRGNGEENEQRLEIKLIDGVPFFIFTILIISIVLK